MPVMQPAPRACARRAWLCALLCCLWLALPAQAGAPAATVAPTSTPAAGTAFAPTDAERAYLAAQPTLTVAYGHTWEPLVRTEQGGGPSGVAVMLLDNLREKTGVTLVYVPLETADRYDLLLCVPDDASLAARTDVLLSTPYVTMPLVLVTKSDRTRAPAAAVQEGFRMPSALMGVPAALTYFATARDCLDAVLEGRQPAAVLNRYMADKLLQSAAYAQLAAHPLEGAAVGACFAVPAGGDQRLLPLLNRLIDSVSTADMNGYIIADVLHNQPINLSTIADQMPTDVALVSSAAIVLVLLLASLIVLRDMRSRQERARTAEIAAFLDYANKVNDDVWEVDVRTLRRWRYRIRQGEITRVPIPLLTQDVIDHNVHPEDIPLVMERVRRLTGSTDVRALEQERFDCRILGAGGFRWARIVFQSMMPSPAHPACVMVYVMDVDDAVRAEEQKNEQLRQALDTAERQSRARAGFAAYISHEIRSPLNAMLGYLTLARMNAHDPERLADCFVKSEYAANHLLQLVGGVLDMGSLDSGKLRLASAGFDIGVLLDTLASIYNALAKTRGILYRVEAGDLPERFLIGDDLRVKQVIVNLLSNAMKFTPTGGSVTLTAAQRPLSDGRVMVRFQVRDTGIGMSEAFQKQLFNIYTQSTEAVDGHFGGSGLGLNIARRLIDLMGGTIAVASEENRGTAFTVEIPFPVDTGRRALATAQPDPHLCLAGKRLLLVEDNDMNMEIATELLTQQGGFVIDGAANGAEAVRRFTQSPAGTYHAVLMDVRMPVMDGYEATRAIRGSGHPDAKTVPILAMTADAFDSDVRQAAEAGMDGHVPKPIDYRALLVKLATYM